MDISFSLVSFNEYKSGGDKDRFPTNYFQLKEKTSPQEGKHKAEQQQHLYLTQFQAEDLHIIRWISIVYDVGRITNGTEGGMPFMPWCIYFEQFACRDIKTTSHKEESFSICIFPNTSSLINIQQHAPPLTDSASVWQ